MRGSGETLAMSLMYGESKSMESGKWNPSLLEKGLDADLVQSDSKSPSACELPNCALRAALLSDIKISDPYSSVKGCPYFRACPGCKALLTHTGIHCSSISCPHCKTWFCFRCLSQTHHNTACTMSDNKQSIKDLGFVHQWKWSKSIYAMKCPSCQRYNVDIVDGQRAVCRSCSKYRISQFQFCRACHREWPRYASTTSACQLPNCALRAALLSDMKINQPNSSVKGCPFFRACPGCKALLTYTGDLCPNITCPHCKTWFCFRCLNHSSHHSTACRVLDNKQSLKDLE